MQILIRHAPSSFGASGMQSVCEYVSIYNRWVAQRNGGSGSSSRNPGTLPLDSIVRPLRHEDAYDHFVSPRPIPEFLHYAPPANIAKLEELIAVTKRVGRKRKEIYQVENLLRLCGDCTSVNVADDDLERMPWGVEFVVNNPIAKALREARALCVDLPIVEQPDELRLQIP